MGIEKAAEIFAGFGSDAEDEKNRQSRDEVPQSRGLHQWMFTSVPTEEK
jgi:hypothetical protein